jgi:Uncharacterized protein conserved in bacteria (DUF2330)
MKLRLGSAALGCAATLLAFTVGSNDAQACGGCFVPPSETTVVSGHRMALAISTDQTVLWDQIEYSGDPADFAWVLPVKPGAVLQVSTDAWFEALEAATATQVVAPPLNCGGGAPAQSEAGGCNSDPFGSRSVNDLASAEGSSGGPGAVPPPVEVVHQGTVGPYETVTLHANEQGALVTWLTENDYGIDQDIQPIIDAYTADGFDFIALRLSPNQGVRAMRPVRVVSPGAVPALPLRMVAAGTGANVALTLYIVGEGRWGTQNFPGATVDAAKLSWDFSTSASNYAELRTGVLAEAEGRTWLTSYAKSGALLSPVTNANQGLFSLQLLDGSSASTIAQAYLQQGELNGETTENNCIVASTLLDSIADSSAVVVNPCPIDGGECAAVPDDQTDARTLACGELDDVAVALTGMHPRDVWVTRLESNLPRAALGLDLSVEAADQTNVDNVLGAPSATNAPCPVAGAITPPGQAKTDGGSGSRRKQATTALTLLFAAGMLVRRAMRRRVAIGASASAT